MGPSGKDDALRARREGGTTVFDYDLEHIFSYNVTIAEPEVVGPVPGGRAGQPLRHRRRGHRA
jgi:hypothetical protein